MIPPPTEGSVLRLRIDALGNDVGGISRIDAGRTVFVRGALPGETVSCSVSRVKKKYIEAELTAVEEPSQHRREPFCENYGSCGGCSLQHLDYSRQLHWKREWIRKAFSRMNLPCDDPVLGTVMPSPTTRGYRNRVSFDITDGRPGLHRYRGDTMPVEGCPLLGSRGTEIFQELLGKDLRGCRRISIRGSDRTGEAMVEFTGIPAAGIPVFKSDPAVALLEEGAWSMEEGKVTFHESLGGFRFAVMPGAFFQVNAGCAELLVEEVTRLCGSGRRILDLYGGSGAFALPLASGGADVTSVEMDPAATLGGNMALEENGVNGVRFVTGRVRSYLTKSISEGGEWDVVTVDPPRAGLGVRVSRLLRRLRADKIVYISCNPFSLARDLGIICENHWKVAEISPIDMFPHTDHVELVVTLSREEER